MNPHSYPLHSSLPGVQHRLDAWRFGTPGAHPRVYLQAGLHADEVPGMLVLTRLRQRLAELDAAGQVRGDILVVPLANPLGLAQRQLGQGQGRFHADSGQNFNRHFPDPGPELATTLPAQLGDDASANVARVRAALRRWLDAQQVDDELGSLRHTLFRLACDADVVLDLHCDSAAELHLYVHSAQQDESAALAGFLGAPVTLHADVQGGQSFDDSCTRPWWLLRQAGAELPMACYAATVELRGQLDVDAATAERDAAALLDYLRWRGALAGPRPTPPAAAPATPLAGTGIARAPCGGIVDYRLPLGSQVAAGELLAELTDPISARVHAITAPVAGRYYAHGLARLVPAGAELCFVAGSQALRRGTLLSA